MVRRGQFATEYLLVAGFMLLAVLGGVYLLYPHMPDSKTVDAQVNLMGNTLIDTATDLYFIGKPSKTTSQAIFPAGLKRIYVDQTNDDTRKELIIQYETKEGNAEKIFLSRVNLAVNLNYLGRGKRDVVLEAKEKAISICVVENLCNCDGICQRPAENHTHCAADCCTGSCHACTGLQPRSPYTCANDSRVYSVCYGHNGCTP